MQKIVAQRINGVDVRHSSGSHFFDGQDIWKPIQKNYVDPSVEEAVVAMMGRAARGKYRVLNERMNQNGSTQVPP